MAQSSECHLKSGAGRNGSVHDTVISGRETSQGTTCIEKGPHEQVFCINTRKTIQMYIYNDTPASHDKVVHVQENA